jgi:hypothetical protein
MLTQSLDTQPVRTLSRALCDPMQRYKDNFDYTKYILKTNYKHDNQEHNIDEDQSR